MAIIALVYFLSVKVGLLTLQADFSTTFWPAVGVGLAVFLRTPPRRWAALMGVLYLSDMAAEMVSGIPLPLCFVYPAVSCGEIAIAAAIVRRLRAPDLGTMAGVWRLALAAAVAAMIISLIATLINMTTRDIPFLVSWWRWGAADFAGCIVAAPAVMLWWDRERIDIVPTLSLAGLNAALAWLVFASPAGGIPTHFVYLTLALPLVAAIRYGPRAAISVVTTSAAVAAVYSAIGRGPYAIVSVPSLTSEILVQSYVVALTLTAMTLAAAASERRQALGQLHAIVDNAPSAIFVKDLDGRFMLVNRAVETLLGRNRSELVGHDSGVGFVPGEAASMRRDDDQVKTTGVPMHLEESINFSGQIRHFTTVKFPLRDGDEHTYAVAGIATDVTERRNFEVDRARLFAAETEARRAAERANKAKDEFLSTLSHELRTPLTAILGWVQIMADDRLSPEERERARQIIERNAQAQVLLVNDLLDTTGIIAGHLRLNFAAFPLERAIEDALAGIRPTAASKRVTLSATIAKDIGQVVADPERLQQIVGNLVSNAVKFSQADGSVHVDARRDGGTVVIDVVDGGIGIAPEALPHVFERFYQVDGSLTRAYGGLGLGLAIARDLADLHGGALSAVSAGLGQGATFTFRWPSPVTSTQDATLQADAALPPLLGVRILLVEDEADQREMLERALRKQGAEVMAVATAAAGREAAAGWHPSVLFCDLGLPDASGFALIERLRAEGVQVPAVALTALARSQDREQALRVGFDEHMAKPCDLSAVVAAAVRLAPRSC